MTKNQYLKGADVVAAMGRLSGTNYATVEVVIGSPQHPTQEVSPGTNPPSRGSSGRKPFSRGICASVGESAHRLGNRSGNLRIGQGIGRGICASVRES
eukprot:97297-Prorocentrum_minimum.AAC.1